MEEDQEGFNEWLEERSKHCTCDISPCDGVMAGGMCDEINHDVDDWHDESE